MVRIEIMRDIPVDEVIPYDNNPFNHAKNLPAVMASIKDFGYNKLSIGVDEKNVLLYGHCTLEALKRLGYTTIPAMSKVHGLTTEQKKGYRIADNTCTTETQLMFDLIAKEMSGQIDFDFMKYGMSVGDTLAIQQDKTTDELNAAAQAFQSNNVPPKKCERLWMYVEFETEEQWKLAVANLGKGNSQRILDHSKLLHLLEGAINETSPIPTC